jgi:hypothetical protein
MLINATPHDLVMVDQDGTECTLPPSGYTLKAETSSVLLREQNGIQFFATSFSQDANTVRDLITIRNQYPDAVIVGSIVAAQAYPEDVVALITTPETIRAEPSKKRYYAYRFTTYGG